MGMMELMRCVEEEKEKRTQRRFMMIVGSGRGDDVWSSQSKGQAENAKGPRPKEKLESPDPCRAAFRNRGNVTAVKLITSPAETEWVNIND